MKKSELKTLETLLAQEGTKGKKLLERFIWLNTHEPKYKVGEYYKVSDQGHYVFGVPVIDMNGKIVEVRSLSEEKRYRYKLELEVNTTDDKHTVATVWKYEEQLKTKTDNNMNVITAKDKYAESIDVNFPC